MKLRWQEPELKSKWNFEQLADAPKEYYREERYREVPRSKCCCGCGSQQVSREDYGCMKPRYVRPHYELGTDENSQLNMIW